MKGGTWKSQSSRSSSSTTSVSRRSAHTCGNCLEQQKQLNDLGLCARCAALLDELGATPLVAEARDRDRAQAGYVAVDRLLNIALAALALPGAYFGYELAAFFGDVLILKLALGAALALIGAGGVVIGLAMLVDDDASD